VSDRELQKVLEELRRSPGDPFLRQKARLLLDRTETPVAPYTVPSEPPLFYTWDHDEWVFLDFSPRKGPLILTVNFTTPGTLWVDLGGGEVYRGAEGYSPGQMSWMLTLARSTFRARLESKVSPKSVTLFVCAP